MTSTNGTTDAKLAVSMMGAARVDLLLGNPNPQPFFGHTSMSFELVADTKCKTAWVSDTHIGFNPAFIAKMPHKQRVATMAHEVLHPALGHNWRRGNRDHHWWNIAADKQVNRILLDAGFELPPNVYIAEGEEIGKSAEWIYAHDLQERLEEQKRKQEEKQKQKDAQKEQEAEQGEPGNPGEGEGSEEGEDEQEDGSDGQGGGTGEEEQDGNGTGDGGGGEDGDESEDDGTGAGNGAGGDGEDEGDDNPFGECRDAGTGPEAQTEEDWKQRTAQAAATARSQGDLPAGLARAIEDALRPKVDVRALLLKFMQEAAPSDYTWSRPNRRYLAQGLYLPAMHDKQLGDVAIMVDTSGSIDSVALAHARGIVQSVLDECQPSGVSLFFADARVAHVERLEKGEPLAWEPKGGGGTDFRPALEAIDNDDHQPVVCICITDLEGRFPEVPPNVPVMWLSTKLRSGWRGDGPILTAPFGETVYIGE